jgi:hypothetical protein
MNCGAFFAIGHLTAAVPPDANVITLLTPATPKRPVQAMSILVFRRGNQPLPTPTMIAISLSSASVTVPP